MRPAPHSHPRAKLRVPVGGVARPEGVCRGRTLKKRIHVRGHKLGTAQGHGHPIPTHGRDHAGRIANHADVALKCGFGAHAHLADGTKRVGHALQVLEAIAQVRVGLKGLLDHALRATVGRLERVFVRDPTRIDQLVLHMRHAAVAPIEGVKLDYVF